MRKSRFTEEQIIAILTEQEEGAGTTEVCRKRGISAATFSNGSRSSAGWMSRIRESSGRWSQRTRS